MNSDASRDSLSLANLIRRADGNCRSLSAPSGEPLSFAELRRQVNYTGAVLRASGIGKADTVAVILPNGPTMASVFLGVSSFSICAPLNPQYGAQELEFYLSDLNATAVIVPANSDSPVRGIAANSGIRVLDLEASSSQAGQFHFRGLGATTEVPPDPGTADDVAMILHTSGTTSRPKMVPLTHRNLCASAAAIARTLALTPDDLCLNVMPLFHIHGLVGVLLSSIAGASVICTPGFDSEQFPQWIAQCRPTWYSAVPTIHQSIIAMTRDSSVCSSHSLRLIHSSSALPPAIMAKLEEIFGVPVIESCGMTETAHQMASNSLPLFPNPTVETNAMTMLESNSSGCSCPCGYEHTTAVTERLWGGFEQAVNMHADRPAVVMSEESLSYAELRERVEALAWRIGEPDPGKRQVVAVMTQRGLPSVVGILAALRAGRIFVYLDPAHPQARVDSILRHCGAEYLVTDQNHLNVPFAFGGRVLIWEDSEAAGTDQICLPSGSSDEAACIIYTSGSTGEPKGVVHTHRALGSEVTRFIHRHSLNAADRVSQVLSPGVIGGLREIFSALLSGATLYPFDLRTHGIGRFRSWLSNERITVCRLVSSLFRELMWALPSENHFPDARVIILGGEAVSQSEVRKFHQQFSASCQLEIIYGLSETGICCCCFADVDFDRVLETVPVGFPTDDYKVRIVNESGEEVPRFQTGQIVVSSRYLSPGYWRQPQLTAQVYRGIAADPNGRWLWTGDLGRQHTNGLIEHLGRCDSQVQVRGNRVEIAEVEKVIINAPNVISAAVVSVKRNDKVKLVAFVRGESEPGSIAQLRRWCASHLPEYAIPSVFRYVESLPHTIQGKVDRQALIARCMDEGFMKSARSALSAAYKSPQTTFENHVADIWANCLGLSDIGVEDDFFELGGDSLVAMRIAVRASQAFGVEIEVRDLFEHRTVNLLAMHIASLRPDLSSTKASSRVSLAREQQLLRSSKTRNRTSLLLLSFAQQRLWFLEQIEGELTAYNMPYVWKLRGALDVDALRRAFEEVVRRHEPLRTTFAMIGEQPVQVIQSAERFDLPIGNLSSFASVEQSAEIVLRCRLEADKPFDLHTDRMLRAQLLQLADDEHLLLVTLHHIASDGWSQLVLWRELGRLYNAYCRGAEPDLPNLPVQYADYAVWQRDQLQGPRLEQLLQYWRGQLADVSVLELPADRSRPSVPTYRGARQNFELPETLVAQLKSLSQASGVTLHMTLLAAFQTLLSRYSGQDDIAVGVPVAGRSHDELEDLIGFFVNTLVLRTDLSADPTFRELLGRVREVSLGAYDHQDLPFERLVEELRPERLLNRTPLVQVTFQLLNFSETGMALRDLDVLQLPSSSQRVRFDLEMHVWQRETTLRGILIYSTDLFDGSTIERMVGHFVTLLEGIVADPDQPISDLPLLTKAERHQLLVEWNDTAVEYPGDKCVHQLFEEQVERTPDAIALIFEEQELTYRELNERANQLAHHLIALGVGPETLVGLCLERSAELVVGVLGILKAGGAYVPLDAALPPQRLEFMLQDAAVEHLVTQSSLYDRFPPIGCSVTCIDIEAAVLKACDCSNPSSGVAADHLAYVMYTSGSTGTPKGVTLTHRAISNHMGWLLNAFPFDAHDNVLQKTPVSFDASVWEFFAPLHCGARLTLAYPGEHRVPTDLVRTISEKRITVLQVVPTLLRALVDEPDFPHLDSLRLLFSGGEELTVSDQRQLFALLPHVQLTNLYGPTECCIDALSWHCDAASKEPRIPIGRPIANTHVYVLDARRQPVPISVPGELYIGGAGLARGYLNRPELTAEKFVANPFSQTGDARLYRTGDLCRWRADGNLEFLGRIDDQVKLRGFRIELGEIESVLNAHPDIAHSVVILREDRPGDKRLVAYFVTTAETVPSPSDLRKHLRANLPEYMVPSTFVEIDVIPLTSSGKINRRALPAPDDSRPELQTSYLAPRSIIEHKLALIWCELLPVDRVGVDDDFFQLGGHSLLAVRLFARIETTFGRRLPLALLFQHGTIRHLAALLAEARSEMGLVSLLELQPNGAGRPLFLMPSIGGELLFSKPLLDEFGTRFPVLGLQPALSPRNLEQFQDFRTTATHFVSALRAYQPHGPYALAGFSYGGFMAYEVACQLHDMGETVDLLAVIDTGPGRRGLPRQTRTRLKTLRGIVTNLPFWLREELRDISVSRWIGSAGRKLRHMRRRLTSRERYTAELDDVFDASRVQTQNRELMRTVFAGFRDYIPERCSVKLTLFRARTRSLLGDSSPDLGWSRFIDDPDICHINGNHETILHSPHVKELARQLSERLDHLTPKVRPAHKTPEA